MPYLDLTQRSTNKVLHYSWTAEIGGALPALYQPWSYFTAAYFSSPAFFRTAFSGIWICLGICTKRRKGEVGWRKGHPLSPFLFEYLVSQEFIWHGSGPWVNCNDRLSSHTQFWNYDRLREGRSNVAQLMSSNLFRHRSSVSILSLYTHILS